MKLIAMIMAVAIGLTACQPVGAPQQSGEEVCEKKLETTVIRLAQAGLFYDLSAFVMTAGCEPVRLKGTLKVTVVAKDDINRRLPPFLENSVQDSPWKDKSAVLTSRYTIHTVVYANVSSDQVALGDTEFLACLSIPTLTSAPAAVDVEPLNGGRAMVNCYINRS